MSQFMEKVDVERLQVRVQSMLVCLKSFDTAIGLRNHMQWHEKPLEEGINEAGAFSAWLAAATSYSTSAYPMVPFYIFYSMFGFQRVGDLIWCAADTRCKGFLCGGTSGRTTLNGEGLQHEDGHSQLMATTVPSLRSYDPAWGFELAVIVQDGLRRMYAEGEEIFYYLSVYNEAYVQPAMPKQDGAKPRLS